jgi:hypothetical protein
MSRSKHTRPRRIRAADRARGLPRVIVQRPRPGRHHPAGRGDVERLLEFFGPEHYYGLRAVRLLRAPAAADGKLPLGRFQADGEIVLYEQPLPPWLLDAPLAPEEAERLLRAGAVIEAVNAGTRWHVDWPGTTLRDFLLLDVFLHEVGHHVLQHERRKPNQRIARTRDHEARADAFARRCRRAYVEAEGRTP